MHDDPPGGTKLDIKGIDVRAFAMLAPRDMFGARVHAAVTGAAADIAGAGRWSIFWRADQDRMDAQVEHVDDLEAAVARCRILAAALVSLAAPPPAAGRVTPSKWTGSWKSLTNPQQEELKRVGRGRQMTYGRSRARVQNSLARMGLVRFCDEDGSRRDVSVVELVSSYANPHSHCEITDKGRLLLEGNDR